MSRSSERGRRESTPPALSPNLRPAPRQTCSSVYRRRTDWCATVLAPGHPESEKFAHSLHTTLVASEFRLFCNVEIGKDLSVDDLRSSYDAVIIATGAPRDAPLDIPGVELPGSFGGAEFVGWYNDHPDAPQHWPMYAESVAVIGGGNVALDVTRMLLVEAQSLQAKDVSDEVREGIAGSRVREVHIFVRRGPADARFSPNELRALGELPGVDVVVDSADVAPDRHVERMTKQLVHTRPGSRDTPWFRRHCACRPNCPASSSPALLPTARGDSR